MPFGLKRDLVGAENGIFSFCMGTASGKPIVSKDKNVVIHCGKVYFKKGRENN